MEQYDVIVIGAGPVGLITSLDLAQRGVKVLTLERSFTPTHHPKMDITNGRTMELFRSLGIVGELRAVAVPVEHVFDVSWISTFDGQELHRFRYPSPAEYERLSRSRNDGTFTAEAPMRVSQAVIEPALKTILEREALATLRYGHAGEAVAADDEGVTVTVADRHNQDRTYHARARYLIGCDGGGSITRGAIGAEFEGRYRIMPRHMTHFRTRGPSLLNRWGHGWHFQSVHGTLISQNDFDIWTLHTRLPDDGPIPSPEELVRRFVGFDLDFEILVENAWSPHLVVADQYQKGRIFIAGDACHQYIPTGGYGMNTGVADGLNISWKLAGVIRGEYGPAILDSYGPERHGVGQRNCLYSERHNDVRVAISSLYGESPQVFDPDPVHDGLRRKLGADIAALGNLENEATGIEYGYAYNSSCLNSADHELEICGRPEEYAPALVPGARLPHVYDEAGRPLIDRLGKGLTVLCQPQALARAEALSARIKAKGLPVSQAELPASFTDLFPSAELLLLRPDHHLIWVGAQDDDPLLEAVLVRLAPQS